MQNHKEAVVEPQHKAEFTAAMVFYYEKLKDPAHSGAIFFAVCRGKVSEGMDFADGHGRAVIITGMPFPPRDDPKVKLKRQFLDKRRTKDRSSLTGDEWCARNRWLHSRPNR